MSDKLKSVTSERKRGSGVKFVYDLLRDEILDLALAPGTPIDEVQLAERFKMSRTPIREALVRLAAEGLVNTLPNRSTMVSNIDFLNLHPLFDALTLMYRVTTRLAAQYHRAEDILAIRAQQTRFTNAVDAHDALEMIASNRDFHAVIADAGRNFYYAGLFKRLLDDSRRILRLYYQSYEDRLPQQFVDEHERIIEAILARDLDAADLHSKAHADQIMRHIQDIFARDQRQQISL